MTETNCSTISKVSYRLLQQPDNEVEYEIAGDRSAQDYFMVNSVNGDVSVMRDLTLDDEDEYKVDHCLLIFGLFLGVTVLQVLKIL